VFCFGGIGTVLTEDPERELDALFARLVERQFAQQIDYQEKIMTQRVAKALEQHRVIGYHQESLGDADYRITLPLVRGTATLGKALRAIKPLDLDKSDTTKIIEHGERWVMRVRHLHEIGYDPHCFLFPVRLPVDSRKQKYAKDITAQLEREHVQVVRDRDKEAILSFAQ